MKYVMFEQKSSAATSLLSLTAEPKITTVYVISVNHGYRVKLIEIKYIYKAQIIKILWWI